MSHQTSGLPRYPSSYALRMSSYISKSGMKGSNTISTSTSTTSTVRDIRCTSRWLGPGCRERACQSGSHSMPSGMSSQSIVSAYTAACPSYIAEDWDGDSNLVSTLQEWNESEYWDLSFPDAHELTQARDTNKACSIKKSLYSRLERSKTFALIAPA